MKKLSMVLMATAMVAFVACGGGKSEGNTDSADTAVVEEVVVEEVVPAASSSNSIDKYFDLVDQYVAAAEKNDVAAIQKIGLEMADLAQNADFTAAMQNMTPEQAQRYQDAAQKMADAAQKIK